MVLNTVDLVLDLFKQHQITKDSAISILYHYQQAKPKQYSKQIEELTKHPSNCAMYQKEFKGVL